MTHGISHTASLESEIIRQLILAQDPVNDPLEKLDDLKSAAKFTFTKEEYTHYLEELLTHLVGKFNEEVRSLTKDKENPDND